VVILAGRPGRRGDQDRHRTTPPSAAAPWATAAP